MNFFNDRDLARRLRDGEVSSKEKFYYLLTFQVIYTIFFTAYVSDAIYSTGNSLDYIADIIIVLLTIIGTYLVYNSNRAGDDEDFIARFTCLSIPIAVHMILFSLLAGFIEAALTMTEEDIMNEDYIYTTTIYGAVGLVLVVAYFYYRINSSIKIASSKS